MARLKIERILKGEGQRGGECRWFRHRRASGQIHKKPTHAASGNSAGLIRQVMVTAEVRAERRYLVIRAGDTVLSCKGRHTDRAWCLATPDIRRRYFFSATAMT